MLNVIVERIGKEYSTESVDILHDMVLRNLPDGMPGAFHCYTDQPDKLHPAIHIHALDEPRVDGLILPLNIAIVGPLDEIAERGLMVDDLAPYDPDGEFPKGKKIISFPNHKQENCGGWVKHVWKIGGGTIAEMQFTPNVSKEELTANIRSAIQRDCKWFEPVSAHEETALIVGGAPSLKEDLDFLRALYKEADIFALNGTHRYLIENGISPDFHVMLDAHPNCLNFVDTSVRVRCYFASQCDAEVLDAAGSNLICWHGGGEAMTAIEGHTFKHVIGGGSTGASRAIMLAYGLGYRKFQLFGLDSSFDGDAVHAYSQAKYANTIDVTCGDEVFKTSPQLLGQAEDFKLLFPDFMQAGCEITVHGKGLLRAIANRYS